MFNFVEVYPSACFFLYQNQEHCRACQLVWQCHCQKLRTVVCVMGRLVALSNDCVLKFEILYIVLLHVIYLRSKGSILVNLTWIIHQSEALIYFFFQKSLCCFYLLEALHFQMFTQRINMIKHRNEPCKKGTVLGFMGTEIFCRT